MSEKFKAIGLVIVLILAVLVGQYWAYHALAFLAHVLVVMAIEIVVSFIRVGLSKSTREH